MTEEFTDNLNSPEALAEKISGWLRVPSHVLDRDLARVRRQIAAAVRRLNDQALAGDPDAFYYQQLLLSRIYTLIMQIPDGPTAEGSIVIDEVTRLLETATVAAEDRWIEPGVLAAAPAEGRAYLSWLQGIAQQHGVFRHPYYFEFINRLANRDDLRRYVIEESLVDSRFDDLLAMMQVGTNGRSKMTIACNFWDEMGNGRSERVHTHLFNKIYEVFHITNKELADAMTANDLLAGNLAVLVCRYRKLHPEAIGFLGMTEWLVPARFENVVHAWERLNLPPVGIEYHRLHIDIDVDHASGWFNNIVLPSAGSEAMRRGIARAHSGGSIPRAVTLTSA